MKRPIAVLAIIAVVMVGATGPVLADDPNFDPDQVEIVSINGEDTDQVNELAIDIHEDIHITLEGMDTPDRPLMVEIGGEVVSHMEEPDQKMRPRSGSNVTTGQQTLQIVYEDRGDRTIVAETEVKVTEVSLDRDDGGGGLGFDPDAVDIASVAGQDADQRNEIDVVYNERISIELDGADATDIYAKVDLDGTHIGSITEGENSFRPREGRDVSEGEQTLTLFRERDGERIVVAETHVDVTRVDLTRDDPDGFDFDPDAVSLATVNGEDPTDLELALAYGEEISFTLGGIDVSEHALQIDLDGTTIGMVSESETSFRPHSEGDIETGEQTLAIKARGVGGDRVVVAETTVTVTEVNLDRDDSREEFEPGNTSIISVNGQPADQRNELEFRRGSSLSLELEEVTVPDRGFHIEIGGEVVGILSEPEDDIRVRRDSDVTTGEQMLEVVYQSEGARTVVAETPVDVTVVNLDGRDSEVAPEEVDLEIVAVNGQSPDGVVVTEHDLRGETPLELEVDGLSDTDHEPSIRYRGETLPPAIDGFEISGNQISLDHLPRVEDGVTANLELVERTGQDKLHVYDSVEIEYRDVPGADSSDWGDEDGTADDEEGTADDEDGTADDEDDDGGDSVISLLRDLFGF